MRRPHRLALLALAAAVLAPGPGHASTLLPPNGQELQASSGIAFSGNLGNGGASLRRGQRPSATIPVNAGGNLQMAIDNAAAGDTILVGPGTYNPDPTSPFVGGQTTFHIHKPLIIRSSGGSGVTTLSRAPGGTNIAVNLRADNVTLEGFTITGGSYGVFVQATVPGGLVNNVHLKDLNIVPSLNAAGHAVYFVRTSNSLIDSCSIGVAPTNAIYLDMASNGNLVINNTVAGTRPTAEGGQHGIALQDSHRNRILRNTVSGGFHGILLSKGPAGTGCDSNRIEWNTVAGQRHDGITVDAGSEFNTIAYNQVDGLSHPGQGTGLWLNSESNGNYAFLNLMKRSPEAGLSVFKASRNYLEANEVSGNQQAGILLWNQPDPIFSVGNRPQYIYVHNNYSHDNPFNGNLNVRDAADVDIAYNHFSGPATGSPDTGFILQTADRVQVYLNTIREVVEGEILYADVTAASLFRNRHLNEGFKHSFLGAGATWDASVFIGGNFWSGHAAMGNPSQRTPFTDFVIDNAGNRGGGYIDHFPFQHATFGRTPAVTVQEPTTGQVIATGQVKTIRWLSQACTFVRIEVGAGGAFQTVQATWPDVGYYGGALATSLPAGATYQVRVTCLDHNGASLGASGTTGNFTVSTNRLTLLSPGRDEKIGSGSTYRVSWSKLAGVGNVDVQLSVDGAPFSNLVTNVAGTFTDVVMPNLSSNDVRLRAMETGGAGGDDATDGPFTLAGGVSGFTSPPAGVAQLIGEPIRLAWVSPLESKYVDLAFWDGSQFRVITTWLPDVGHYTWFVPEFWTTGSKLRISFRNAAGEPLLSQMSADFNLRYLLPDGTGNAINRYRMYNDVTNEHLFTTDFNEYTVLPQLSPHWIQEGVSHKLYTGPFPTAGVPATPLYRLYNTTTTRHLWTTDRNEYLVLRPFEVWVEEHVDGYMYPVPVPGTVPLYRLLYSFSPLPLHHWTTDQFEYDTLPSQGWIQEGAIGYVLP